MDDERWKAVRAALDQALSLTPGERSAWLEGLRSGDGELAREVQALLERDGDPAEPAASPVEASVGGLFGAPALAPGARLGAYEVREVVASGGMGTVYRGERADAQFEKSVAIKLIKRGMDSEDILRRFRYERQVLAGLEHPGIARLIDGGASAGGQPFLVMEFVEGAPIDEWCDGRELGVVERLRLFQQVCRAVHYAHQRLVVHRDLKPSNILVTEDGEAKLLDFGVAKVLNAEGDPERSQWTQGEGFFGTPAFASPEQVQGEHVTTASDVYSLGVVLYLLLTGRRPHDLSRLSSAEARRVLCGAEPQRPSEAITREGDSSPLELARRRGAATDELRTRLAGDLDNIVLKALRKEPERRYASAERLAEDIGRHLTGLPVEARPSTWGYLASKFVARHRVSVGIASALVLSLLGGILLSSNYYLQASDASQEATRRYEDVRELASRFIFSISGDMGPLEGSVAARERIARAGLEYLDRLAGESHDDPRLMRELGNAYLYIGDVLGGAVTANLGRREEAESSYDKAFEIAGGLLESGAAEPESIELLAKCLIRLGDMRKLEGDSGAAVARYEQALERCPADDPAAILRVTRSIALSRIADVLLERGEHAEALELQFESLAIQEQQLEAEPGSADRRHDLSIAHSKIGEGLLRQQRWEEAESHYVKGIELLSALLEENAADSQLRLQFAAAQFDLGLMYHRQERNEEALEHVVVSREIREMLVAADPQDVAARRALALDQQVLSQVLVKLGRADEGLDMQLESLETKRSLVRLDPENALYRRDLAMGLTLVGGMRIRSRDLEEAQELIGEGLELFEALAEEDPDRAEARRDLVACTSNMGALHMGGANDTERELVARHEHAGQAEVWFARALETLEGLKAEGLLSPSDEQYIDKMEWFLGDAQALSTQLAGELEGAGPE